MTELLEGEVEVRMAQERPVAVLTPAGWRDIQEIVLTWRVETDWWRAPARRDYLRCLLRGGDCVELYRDLDDGSWHWGRRYD